MKTSDILKTATAKCHDCYRCVRACPVKAIGIKDGQAYIDDARCVLCGTCVRECPQKAKIFRSDVDKVKDLIKNHRVVASIAPSFAALFDGWKSMRIPSALRKLGFVKVEETSVGADMVSIATNDYILKNNDGTICSACPASVFYVEKHKSDMVESLLPICSPMIAHAKSIKNKDSDVKVVFIGPCIAKKAESERAEYSGIIDAVLTFTELQEWLESSDILLETCPESDFNNIGATSAAKIFALPGGMLETVGIACDNCVEIIHTSGAENTKMLMDAALTSDDMMVIEPLFCDGGCISGPGIVDDTNLFQRRSAILNYSKASKSKKTVKPNEDKLDLSTAFLSTPVSTPIVTEQQILEVLDRTGKSNPDYRLDCGACGYVDCRSSAIAIISGMAEDNMCLSHIRRLAEKRTDNIMESTPNGIVIIDENHNIVNMNPSFKSLFLCNNQIVGRPISYLIKTNDYNDALKSTEKYLESIIKHYGKEFHQIVYYLPIEKQFVGIYVDISKTRKHEAKIASMRKQTLEHVELLMKHQIEMTQQMTVFLGENSAKSEYLLQSLMADDE